MHGACMLEFYPWLIQRNILMEQLISQSEEVNQWSHTKSVVLKHQAEIILSNIFLSLIPNQSSYYIFTVDKTCWSLSWHQISTKSKILPTERKITDLNPEGVETIWAQVSFQKRSPTTEVYASGTQATLTSLQTKPGSPEDYAGIWVDIGFVEGMRRSSFLFSIQHFFFQLSSVLHICLSFSACLYLSFLSPLTFSLNHADKSSGLLAFSFSCEKKKKRGGGRGIKALLSVLLLLLYGTGRTKAFPDRPDSPISTQPSCLYPVSSPHRHVLFSLSVILPPSVLLQ